MQHGGAVPSLAAHVHRYCTACVLQRHASRALAAGRLNKKAGMPCTRQCNSFLSCATCPLSFCLSAASVVQAATVMPRVRTEHVARGTPERKIRYCTLPSPACDLPSERGGLGA